MQGYWNTYLDDAVFDTLLYEKSTVNRIELGWPVWSGVALQQLSDAW